MIKTAIDENAYLAWLASVKMPAEYLVSLLSRYENGETVYRMIKTVDPAIQEVLPQSYLEKLKQNAESEQISFFAGQISRYSIKALTLHDQEFPQILTEIPDPVSILFYQGNLGSLPERKISMVGSRQASYTGLTAAKQIARDLSMAGITVVSGFAYGIDAASHQGCIEGGSPTVAVMGCGLDCNYPADHSGLRRKVLDSGGVLLTEYAPGEKPMAGNFPYRNRIIAAMGEALVLVEAKIRSGSLRTVDHALAQGKEVFVYPGDPSSLHFEGNHQLLREGGHYFTSARDILEDMDWLDKKPRDVQNSGCNESRGDMIPAEDKIRKLLMSGMLSFDQLTDMSGIPPSQLLSLLTIMQVRGTIEPVPGKKYQLKT